MYDRHLTMGDAKDEMQEQQRQEKIRWWRGLAEKTKWPNSGVYFVLPDNDPEATENEMILLHETGPEIPFRIDEGETMEYIKSFFGEVFPDAAVLIPGGFSSETHWWQGPCICSACSHTWQGVVEIPVEATSPQVPLECSECHQMTGGPA